MNENVSCLFIFNREKWHGKCLEFLGIKTKQNLNKFEEISSKQRNI